MRIKSVVSLLILLVAGQNISKAQTAVEHPNQVSLNTGLTLSGVLLNRLFESSDSVKYSLNSSAPAQLTYQRDLAPWFRLGITYSRQTFDLHFDQYIDETGILQTGDFDATFKRSNIMLKPSVVKSWDRFEVFVGGRVGVGAWKVNVDSDKLSLKFINRINGLVLPSVGGFAGAQMFLTENIGVNAELNLGAPHLLSVGLAARF